MRSLLALAVASLVATTALSAAVVCPVAASTPGPSTVTHHACCCGHDAGACCCAPGGSKRSSSEPAVPTGSARDEGGAVLSPTGTQSVPPEAPSAVAAGAPQAAPAPDTHVYVAICSFRC